jgi:hypothetical protein
LSVGAREGPLTAITKGRAAAIVMEVSAMTPISICRCTSAEQEREIRMWIRCMAFDGLVEALDEAAKEITNG